jgi:hypothetical protein
MRCHIGDGGSIEGSWQGFSLDCSTKEIPDRTSSVNKKLIKHLPKIGLNMFGQKSVLVRSILNLNSLGINKLGCPTINNFNDTNVCECWYM